MASTNKPDGRRKAARPAAKRPFDIEEAIPLLREAVAPYPKAALFELAAEGHTSVFELLVACIISIRTRDETTLPVARGLFAAARTPADDGRAVRRGDRRADRRLHLPRAEGEDDPRHRPPRPSASTAASCPATRTCCCPSAASARSAPTWRSASPAASRSSAWTSTSTASPTAGATSQATTPEKTMAALQEKLPQPYWVEINALLVPFGKHVCTGDAAEVLDLPAAGRCAGRSASRRTADAASARRRAASRRLAAAAPGRYAATDSHGEVWHGVERSRHFTTGFASTARPRVRLPDRGVPRRRRGPGRASETSAVAVPAGALASASGVPPRPRPPPSTRSGSCPRYMAIVAVAVAKQQRDQQEEDDVTLIAPDPPTAFEYKESSAAPRPPSRTRRNERPFSTRRRGQAGSCSSSSIARGCGCGGRSRGARRTRS